MQQLLNTTVGAKEQLLNTTVELNFVIFSASSWLIVKSEIYLRVVQSIIFSCQT